MPYKKIPMGAGARRGHIRIPSEYTGTLDLIIAAKLEGRGFATIAKEAKEFVEAWVAENGSLDFSSPPAEHTLEFYPWALNVVGRLFEKAEAKDDDKAMRFARDVMCTLWGEVTERKARSDDEVRGEKIIASSAQGGEARSGKTKVGDPVPRQHLCPIIEVVD